MTSQAQLGPQLQTVLQAVACQKCQYIQILNF